jgi:hypothetical protein
MHPVLPAKSKFNMPSALSAKLFRYVNWAGKCGNAQNLSQPELGASTLMLGIYFGLFRSLYSNKLGMHTFIQHVSDLSEHVWKAAGLQHAYATNLPLCKSSSLQTSMLPTCIARCLPK